MSLKGVWAGKGWDKTSCYRCFIIKISQNVNVEIEVDADKLYTFQLYFLLYEIRHNLIFS